MHLDKTLLGAAWVPHRGGRSGAERIEAEKAIRREVETPGRRAGTAARRAGRRLRDGPHALPRRCRHRGRPARPRDARPAPGRGDAFPRYPARGLPAERRPLRARRAELLDEALRAGADVVGGVDPIGIDADLDGQLDVVFGLAERHGAPIDIHLHDRGRLAPPSSRRSRPAPLGPGPRGPRGRQPRLGARGARRASLRADGARPCRGGRRDHDERAGLPADAARQALAAEGVEVFAGSDNVRDAWSPLGNGDMLERASLVAYRQGLATDDDLEVCFSLATERAALALGLAGDYGLREGAAADLIAVRAEGLAEAVAAHPPRALSRQARPDRGGGRIVSV